MLLLSDTAYATEQSYRLTDDVRYNTDADGYYKTITTGGSWPDINYQSELRGAWKTSWHLYRVMLLCRSYYKNHDQQYLAAIHRALNYWITNDFQSSNWWQNQINTPYTFSSIMLMLDKDASPAEMAYLDNVLVKRIPQKHPTGQNLIWQLDNEARVALVHEQYAELASIIKKMQEVITVSASEGIQPDYSFQQHGPMLQFGNYGFHYINSLLFWMTVTANTPLAFSADKQQILFNYCANGLRCTIFKGAMDIAAVGRQLRENFDTKRGQYLYNNFNLLRSFDKNYKGKYSIDGFTPTNELPGNLKGNKSFWRSDYMIQLAAGTYMMSVKTHGAFVKKVESINSENLKGSFLNDGLTIIKSNGNEYRNIEPCWNWAMLPGTTCDTTIIPAAPETFAASNQSAFVGQASDGVAGVSAMNYNRQNVQAHKSYFFINDMMVALGAGLSSANNKNLVTTVNQRLYNGKPLLKGAGVKGTGWLWQDSIAYILPVKDEPVKTSIEYRHGNWTDIDKGSDSKIVADSVLTIYIPHATNSSYAYMVKPAISLACAKQLVEQNPIQIISNTTSLQAIKAGNKTIAVFYLQGYCKIAANTGFKVDKPCIVICEQSGGKKIIHVSDPTRSQQNIKLSFGKKDVIINLPQGALAGDTVSYVVE
jgi:chondroitin AC lyase